MIHDEVSETENIRKNLTIERMIVEGCDILLDINQIFVRQGECVLAASTDLVAVLCRNTSKTPSDGLHLFTGSNVAFIASFPSRGARRVSPHRLIHHQSSETVNAVSQANKR